MRLTILTRQRLVWAFLGLLLTWNAGTVRAQEIAEGSADNLLPLIQAQGADGGLAARKLTLDECIKLGMEKQPALAASRASLGAAESGQQGLNRLVFAGLLKPDLKIRRQQACLGVQIASAALLQEEWQTRYAITRNYYSVIYARQQAALSEKAFGQLDRAAQQAEKIVKGGDPNSKVNQIDVENLIYNRDSVKVRGLEAVVGENMALAALREAMGLSQDQALDISGAELPPLASNLSKKDLIALALAQRGEMTQVQAAYQVTDLEIRAQQMSIMPSATTFAVGADLHAKPVPQGTSNGSYRPWAFGIEYPATLAGHRRDRVQRAMFLRERVDSVVEKTQQLITLEVEDSFAKWELSARQLAILQKLRDRAKTIADFEQKRFDGGNTNGADLIRARLGEDQAELSYNQALYNHALGLAALERVTAGGYRINP